MLTTGGGGGMIPADDTKVDAQVNPDTKPDTQGKRVFRARYMHTEGNMSVRDAAAFLGVRVEEIYRLIRSNRLKARKVIVSSSPSGMRGYGKGVWLIKKSSILEHMERRDGRKRA